MARLRHAEISLSSEVRRLVLFLDKLELEPSGYASFLYGAVANTVRSIVAKYGRAAVREAYEHGFIEAHDADDGLRSLREFLTGAGADDTYLTATSGGLRWARSGRPLP